MSVERSNGVGCEGKFAFDSFQLATQVAKRHRRTAAKFPYRCKECGKIHLATADVTRKLHREWKNQRKRQKHWEL